MRLEVECVLLESNRACVLPVSALLVWAGIADPQWTELGFMV